ncbi:bifunctional tRNA (5-methylaminomethyl-2-thiouridine)(34)-methyltransferase MnmD/FAD-dependent 5-carboxymethylaminomethyl-2-thiouridine(34) oxidoreductase MnmC [Celerinatantimonas sp. YJH-8]|uniref:bifunctional tRNA (5-methylaminomethyl-2-thiouridine)(34)-methyltransferase MnmD/FAD-dependent 5-carboxymethylaminomethyl-2-thiouridine(34) oxidoreductase MnmC n=1 Tax=Celerinatantimonas sp. YJH-8 TaxID=3228714 RepID=UPI0038C28169
MVNSIHPAEISWNEQGLPVANQFDDVYFSNDDGLAETRYVFLNKNGLPQRWASESFTDFVIAESGFGSGLNFLATWQMFNHMPQDQRPQHLHFISFEKYPLHKQDLIRTLDHWPELHTYAKQLHQKYPDIITQGCQRIIFEEGELTLDLWFGDIHESLQNMAQTETGLVDCWFLDGFAPSKNPEMWTQELFDLMAKFSKNNATLATFTAAGFVRRGLIQAGFNIQKAPGFGHKREMLQGRIEIPSIQSTAAPWFYRPTPKSDSDVVIIGAGLAGASLSYALSLRKIKHTIYEQAEQSASAASGNRQGAIYPLLQSTQSPINDFFCNAFNFNRRTLAHLLDQGYAIRHQWCGVLQLGYDEKSAHKLNKLEQVHWPEALLQHVDSQQASDILGQPVEHSGIFYPNAGWANPQDLVNALLTQSLNSGYATVHYQSQLQDWLSEDGQVKLTINGQPHDCQQLILANGHQVIDFSLTSVYPITPVRGQVTHIQTTAQTAALKTVLCYDGYLTPACQQTHCIGATYQRNQLSRELSAQDTRQNLEALAHCIQQPWTHDLQVDPSIGRAAIRATLRDHLPMMGPLVHIPSLIHQFAHIPQPELKANLHQVPLVKGVYLLAGLGARGVCSAPLLGEIMASEIAGTPYPISQSTLDALHPGRFWIRRLCRNQPITPF